MSNERRTQQRQRVLKPARIVLPGGQSTLKCVVMDLSGGGARLKTDQWLLMPNAFRLQIIDGPTYEASVCHRYDTSAGVKFVETEAA